jgi:hypothetical protein
MTRITLKLTDRHDVAQRPANNLAIALAFAGLGLLNGLLNLIPGGLAFFADFRVFAALFG